MVDFSNPDAANWFKDVIKNFLVKEAHSSGWMQDFGEYVPMDAVPFSGEEVTAYHNKYLLLYA